jgi:hypothetical protein
MSSKSWQGGGSNRPACPTLYPTPPSSSKSWISALKEPRGSSKPRRPPSPAMASSNVPVVVYLDDDDVTTHPSSRNRKRSHGSASTATASASSRDSPDAFSSSPPLHKRLLLAASASAPIDLDDTPPPPTRRPPSAPEPPVHVLDDDTDPSVITDDYVPETPHSVLARLGSSQTPELDASGSGSPDIVVAETPGFTSPRSGRPPAPRRFSSAEPAQKSSGNKVSQILCFEPGHSLTAHLCKNYSFFRFLAGASCPISLDSDDEPNDAIYRELIGSPSTYQADQNEGMQNLI